MITTRERASDRYQLKSECGTFGGSSSDSFLWEICFPLELGYCCLLVLIGPDSLHSLPLSVVSGCILFRINSTQVNLPETWYHIGSNIHKFVVSVTKAKYYEHSSKIFSQSSNLVCGSWQRQASFLGPNSTEPNLFNHGKTTYRVGWLSEYATVTFVTLGLWSVTHRPRNQISVSANNLWTWRHIIICDFEFHLCGCA